MKTLVADKAIMYVIQYGHIEKHWYLRRLNKRSEGDVIKYFVTKKQALANLAYWVGNKPSIVRVEKTDGSIQSYRGFNLK